MKQFMFEGKISMLVNSLKILTKKKLKAKLTLKFKVTSLRTRLRPLVDRNTVQL